MPYQAVAFDPFIDEPLSSYIYRGETDIIDPFTEPFPEEYETFITRHRGYRASNSRYPRKRFGNDVLHIGGIPLREYNNYGAYGSGFPIAGFGNYGYYNAGFPWTGYNNYGFHGVSYPGLGYGNYGSYFSNFPMTGYTGVGGLQGFPIGYGFANYF